MLLLEISQTSIAEVAEYIDHVKERALVGIRLGMRDGVRGLAQAEVEAGSAHPPAPGNKESDHLATILGRAGRVIETEDEINAVYQPRSAGKQPHYWLEFGADVPEVEHTLMRMNLAGEEFFRFGHKAFHIPAHPFFFSTAQSYLETWMQVLFGRVDEAMNA
jgi:hypothetical protein